MGFPRQKYWSGFPFPPPGDLPDPGIEPMSLALAGGFFTTEPPGKLYMWNLKKKKKKSYTYEIILQKSYNSSEFTYMFDAASSNVDTYITIVYASKIRNTGTKQLIYNYSYNPPVFFLFF